METRARAAERTRVWYRANKEHAAEVNRTYYETHREAIKARSRAYYQTYRAPRQGATVADIEALYERQAGLCAICECPGRAFGEPGSGRVGVFHVDHDHDTGAVRGLLCQSCNFGLAALERHGSAWLARVQRYLGIES